ncbi:hypothetical protein B0H17DRAFT_1086626, partial [Mycena rosella]
MPWSAGGRRCSLEAPEDPDAPEALVSDDVRGSGGRANGTVDGNENGSSASNDGRGAASSAVATATGDPPRRRLSTNSGTRLVSVVARRRAGELMLNVGKSGEESGVHSAGEAAEAAGGRRRNSVRCATGGEVRVGMVRLCCGGRGGEGKRQGTQGVRRDEQPPGALRLGAHRGCGARVPRGEGRRRRGSGAAAAFEKQGHLTQQSSELAWQAHEAQALGVRERVHSREHRHGEGELVERSQGKVGAPQWKSNRRGSVPVSASGKRSLATGVPCHRQRRRHGEEETHLLRL